MHPDALTPWKAENLWRLYMATANHLDRNVDEERVQPARGGDANVVATRVDCALLPGQTGERRCWSSFWRAFRSGMCGRGRRSRCDGQFQMAQRLEEEAVQLDFRYAPETSEITLVTPGPAAVCLRDMAGALAAWGMNIVTADAFSNRQGVVVDSFRFHGHVSHAGDERVASTSGLWRACTM